MIKAEDLRIGDLVYVNRSNILPYESVCTIVGTQAGTNYGVECVSLRLTINDWGLGTCGCDDLDGIPITPKIIENNGWKLYEPSTKMYIKSNSNLAVCFPPHSDKVQVYYVVEHLRTIKYVHEFQHVLWALGMDVDLKIPEKSDGKEAKP